MKNILVPTDFSLASINATAYAVSLAKSFDAIVTLVNIVSPPVIIDDSILASVLVTQAEILENNKKIMESEIEDLSNKNSIKISGFVREGSALDKIQEMAKVKHADLIVMGMKGKGKSKSVFGSTTTAIIRNTNYPVLVIPEKATFKPVNNITFASDFDATIKMDRYTILLEISGKFNSLINIINVQKKNSSLQPEKAIGKMKTSLAFSKYKHQFHTINENKVEEGIHKFIEIHPTDILAMVAHKHSLFERMFGKVHTKAMSYQTKIPLLVLQSK